MGGELKAFGSWRIILLDQEDIGDPDDVLTRVGADGAEFKPASGGGNPFDQDLNTDDNATFASVSAGTAPFASTGVIRLPFEGGIYSRDSGNTQNYFVTGLVDGHDVFPDFLAEGTAGAMLGADNMVTILGRQVMLSRAGGYPSIATVNAAGTDELILIEVDPATDQITYGSNSFASPTRIMGTSITLDGPVTAEGITADATTVASLTTDVITGAGNDHLTIASAGNLDLVLDADDDLRLLADDEINLAPTGNLTINGTPGLTQEIELTGLGTLSVTKGIITGWTPA